MQFLDTVLYFIITLGVLVFVHEFGHFIAAKLCHMRVDRFSIGFPPRAFGKKIGETDYCVSWIPVGGYVKIAGMIDESFDTEYLSKPPEPWEFRARPLWQRMIVITAGVIMNLLLAVAIFWGINYFPVRELRDTTQIAYVSDGSPADRAGLKMGDRILQVNGNPVHTWEEMLAELYGDSTGPQVPLTALRGGSEVRLGIARSDIPDPTRAAFGVVPMYTGDSCYVKSVEPGMPADRIGIRRDDILLSLNGERIHYDQKIRERVRESAGKPLTIRWLRDRDTLSGTTTPTDDGKIGIVFQARYNGPVITMKNSMLQALGLGVRVSLSASAQFLDQIWQLVTGKAAISQSVGGPIKIAQLATQSAELGILVYLAFVALLSISLAILNVLPFPALDGGHLLFLVYEGIFHREIPVKLKIGLQKAGFVLLLAFMAFVVYNDIRHF